MAHLVLHDGISNLAAAAAAAPCAAAAAAASAAPLLLLLLLLRAWRSVQGLRLATNFVAAL